MSGEPLEGPPRVAEAAVVALAAALVLVGLGRDVVRVDAEQRCRAEKDGAVARSSRDRPVWVRSPMRRNIERTGTPIRVATPIARTSAGSKPRARRRAVVVGANVTTTPEGTAPGLPSTVAPVIAPVIESVIARASQSSAA